MSTTCTISYGKKGPEFATVVTVILSQPPGPHSLEGPSLSALAWVRLVGWGPAIVGWGTLVRWGFLTRQMFHLNDKVHLNENSSNKDQQNLTDHYLAIMEKLWIGSNRGLFEETKKLGPWGWQFWFSRRLWNSGCVVSRLLLIILNFVTILTVNTRIEVTGIYFGYFSIQKESNSVISSLIIQEACEDLKRLGAQNQSHQLPHAHRCLVTFPWDFMSESCY